MTAELASNPDSLVFLELGEALRRRGQLYAAAKAAVVGLERHPQLADSHDLYARILVDMGHLQQAYDEWQATVELDPQHLGAHKGLGFLCYRWGDLDGALEHLELAVAADPMDQSVVQALQMVRGAAAELTEAPEEPQQSVFQGLDGAHHGLLLFDTRGRVLGGGMSSHLGEDVSRDVAAYVSGGCQEADRSSRILELGDWRWMVLEGPGGSMHVSRSPSNTLLLVARDGSVPSGRLAVLAKRAAEAARQWLEAQQP
ncbi:MAG: tetratricopeptide repeat protein [Gemmatimonadota bacterium]|nr:MAG: tetratricopeptide repeat protein [Gemmatimonadota bacterium]